MAGQKSVYNNVERMRVTDNGEEIEDVTSVTLPTIENPTTTIGTGGMAGEMNLPDTAFVNAMSLSIAHNSGRNSKLLQQPGRHSIVVSVARQKYDSAGQEIGFKNVTYKFIAMHTKTDKGKAEPRNPMSMTDEFSVLRMEETMEGEQITLIDVPNGTIRINGKDYSSSVEQALNE